jgi:hypothetical protein
MLEQEDDRPGEDDHPPLDPPTRTLGSQDPEAAATYMHKHRKIVNTAGKRKDKLDKALFLSNVVENDRDVDYRFEFTVVGLKAERIIEAVCESEAASGLGGIGLDAGNGYRCLCEVPGSAGEAPKVAKLAFHVLGSLDKDPLPCVTRQQALSSAIVYALDVGEGEQSFAEQIEQLRSAKQRLRSATRARLRPVKALLLWSSGQEKISQSGLQCWAVQLNDFEVEHGDMWKFGPVLEQDGNSLHEIFGEMTSARISYIDAGDDVEDLDQAEPPANPEDSFRPTAGLMQRRPSSAASSISEQECPPQFTAEESGSECNEDSLALHARTFGITLPETVKGLPVRVAL